MTAQQALSGKGMTGPRMRIQYPKLIPFLTQLVSQCFGWNQADDEGMVIRNTPCMASTGSTPYEQPLLTRRLGEGQP
jgi:hypothetical protein